MKEIIDILFIEVNGEYLLNKDVVKRIFRRKNTNEVVFELNDGRKASYDTGTDARIDKVIEDNYGEYKATIRNKKLNDDLGI